MSQSNWMILILVLVAALVYGAFLLGRASALSQMRRDAGLQPQPEPERNAQNYTPAHIPSAAPPPVLAGGEKAQAGGSAASPVQPRRSSVAPPAASAGPGPAAAGPASASTPRRTAAPPPAQAAWSKPPTDGKD